MNKKSFLYDWGLWLLLAMNIYAIYFYQQNPQRISTIIFIFWLQSVFIGLFNVLGILSFTNRVTEASATGNDINNKPGCAAAFFAVHYGFFHLGYAIFILIQFHSSNIDWLFIKLSFYTILLGSIIQFIQDKQQNKTKAVNMNTMFFMPYARIIPMHLALLLPSFLHISIGVVFLSLKVVADIIMHVVYRNYLFK